MAWWEGKWDTDPGPGRWQFVDPNRGRLEHEAENTAAVKFYERNPHGYWDSQSGEPLLTRDGIWNNGNHRVQAARNVGRKVWAWVQS